MQGVNYTNFIDGIRSPASKKGYRNSIARYCRYLKLTKVDDLMLHSSNPKLIEEQIKGYIKSLEHEGVSYATRKFLIAPIFSFYHLNDVLLNRRRVSRYLGEFNRVVKDSAYTTEQIHAERVHPLQHLGINLKPQNSTEWVMIVAYHNPMWKRTLD